MPSTFTLPSVLAAMAGSITTLKSSATNAAVRQYWRFHQVMASIELCF
jgi:hypothetical protein